MISRLTENIILHSKGYLSTIPEISSPNSGYTCFHAEDWESDGGSVEVETAEFLYGLVRLMKPDTIVETGTHAGISSAYMAQACYDNSKGLVHTCEHNFIWHQRARELHKLLNVDRFVNNLHMSSFLLADTWESAYQSGPIDILFLDTEPDIRYVELEGFFEYVKPGGLIFIHDLHPNMSYNEAAINPDHPHLGHFWPFGNFVNFQGDLIKDHLLLPIHFKTPRGLTMYYKPDYENDIDAAWAYKDKKLKD